MIEELSGDFLQWLRGFYFVAKGKSFSRAALEMRRNQPTISHQVKCLEKEFGITLFDRSGNKINLTPEGRFFFQKAITVFEQIKDMREYVNKALSNIEGQIRIASTQAIIRFFLPNHISEFTKTYPKVTFYLEGGDRDHILTEVESAVADFGILFKDLVPKDFVYYDLFQTKPVLIASKKSPYFKEKFPTLDQIAKLPFVGFPKTSTQTQCITRRFLKEDLKLNVVMVLNNFETAKKYVELGSGVSILDDYTLTKEDKDILDIFSLEKFFGARGLGIVMRKRKYLSVAVKAFLKEIKPDIPIK